MSRADHDPDDLHELDDEDDEDDVVDPNEPRPGMTAARERVVLDAHLAGTLWDESARIDLKALRAGLVELAQRWNVELPPFPPPGLAMS